MQTGGGRFRWPHSLYVFYTVKDSTHSFGDLVPTCQDTAYLPEDAPCGVFFNWICDQCLQTRLFYRFVSAGSQESFCLVRKATPGVLALTWDKHGRSCFRPDWRKWVGRLPELY